MLSVQSVPDGTGRELRKIVSKEFDTDKTPVRVAITLDCGCVVYRNAPRVPRGTHMYCQVCREKKQAASR